MGGMEIKEEVWRAHTWSLREISGTQSSRACSQEVRKYTQRYSKSSQTRYGMRQESSRSNLIMPARRRLKRAFDGVEAYFCLSPLIQNLAETGIQAVEVAKQAGVRRIVEASGISYTILQPMAFMQNYLLFAGTIRNYKERGALLCPSGRRKSFLCRHAGYRRRGSARADRIRPYRQEI